MLSYKWVTQGIGLLMELGACTLCTLRMCMSCAR